MLLSLNDIAEEFLTSPFASLIGLDVSYFEEGEVLLRVPIKEQQYNTMGTVHGGVYATLLDTAMAMAIKSVLKVPSVTVNMNVNFMSGASKGTLYVKGKIVKQGYRIVVAEADIFDEKDALLANASGTFKVMRNLG